ncbi:MAG: hypothetical protein ACTSV3_07315 [Candidatus Thorarchaeota archaeon]|nr:MAG: hypothetical protein DRP09_15650 [Candidatus Thorarchaeota archaeon]
MSRPRGRPARPLPVHPERVISRAVKAGLSATLELQRNIANKKTRRLYESSRAVWKSRRHAYLITKRQRAPDFSHISKAEALMRDNMKRMLYENAARYGFTEVRRQKNADDTVDPLNQRLNICGRVIRENSEIMYPFPTPEFFGSYTRRDGRDRKKFRKAGYTGSSFGPKVVLAHPDLPSLDFGDSIRSHNEYLATFCAIHDVPVRETSRYSNLFFLQTRPYLDHLYSEGKYGMPNFQKGVNRALRFVKDLILAAGYRPTVYTERTVTGKLDESRLSQRQEDVTFFKKQEEEARAFYGDHPAVNELSRLATEGSYEEGEAILRGKDVQFIRDLATRRARVAGSIVHRRIADLFPSPWQMKNIILSGDKYSHDSEYVVFSETPVQTELGTGRVDLMLCVRTISEDGKHVFWMPVLIAEIKTRLGQSWCINAKYKESEVRPAGSPLQRIVPDFMLRNHPLSDDLWSAVVESTPTPSARRQLSTYARAIADIYRNTTQQEPANLVRGVLVIESSSNIAVIRSLIQSLLIRAYESVEGKARIERTVLVPKTEDGRIAFVIDEQQGPGGHRKTAGPPSWNPPYTPFGTSSTKRRFLLYLAGHSPTSAGQSAAWNALHYHGLQMLYEMEQTHKNTSFIWLDLASQFNEPGLAEARLHLRPRGLAEEKVIRAQPDHIRSFFEGIEVRGYVNEILSYLYGSGKLPSFEIGKWKRGRLVIVVSGADTLRHATPISHRDRLDVLIDHLVHGLPDSENITVVWFDSPVPSVEKAVPYSSRALLPFYETSSLGEVVSEIVWNLPIAPRGAVDPRRWGLPTIADSPMYDDIRIIVRHTPEDIHVGITLVPLLGGWSKRFKNMGAGLMDEARSFEERVPDKELRNRMKLLAFCMLPWIARRWPNLRMSEDSVETLEEQMTRLERLYCKDSHSISIERAALNSRSCNPPSALTLLRFRLPTTMDALSYQNVTVGRINSQRLYRSQRRLRSKPPSGEPDSTTTKALVHQEEPERWLFGVKYESLREPLPWWMIIQDPSRPSRLLVGCFIDKSPDKEGYLWAESGHEIMKQASIDEVLDFTRTEIICRKRENGLETWTRTNGETSVYTGVLEVKGHGQSMIGHLTAIRHVLTEAIGSEPSFDTRPPEVFHTRVVESLRRYYARASGPTPISIRLEMVEDVCHVTLWGPDNERIQTIAIKHTADLISFLRWPMIKKSPMPTDSGEFVTWNLFDDIDYGELDFIRPYVTFTSARQTPAELPSKVFQFFDDADTLDVTIRHVDSVCPVVCRGEMNHGSCWEVVLPPDCPSNIKKELNRTMTGEEVNAILAPGRYFSRKLFHFDVTLPAVSERDESIVFHEDRFIRILFRQQGRNLKPLAPGTFLMVDEQHWKISVEWDEREHFRWHAQSVLTNLLLTGCENTVKLRHGHGAEEERDRLMKVVESCISPDRIANYDELSNSVLVGLKKLGYTSTSPTCEIRVMEQSTTELRCGIFSVEGVQRTPYDSFTIRASDGLSCSALVEGVEEGLDAGSLSKYNIKNRKAFLERVQAWAQKSTQLFERVDNEKGWTVTLMADVDQCAILWKAEEDETGKVQSGVLFDDPKFLLNTRFQRSVREIREIAGPDLTSQLGSVLNLDDVRAQVPDLVRELRHIMKS